MAQDAEMGRWRSYRPNDPEDQARARETRKAPPLIPARFYDYGKIAWENKKDETPKTVPCSPPWA